MPKRLARHRVPLASRVSRCTAAAIVTAQLLSVSHAAATPPASPSASEPLDEVSRDPGKRDLAARHAIFWRHLLRLWKERWGRPSRPAPHEGCEAALRFDRIADEASGFRELGGLRSLPLNTHGEVLLTGVDGAGEPYLLIGDGSVLTPIGLSAWSLGAAYNGGIDDAGNIVFAAHDLTSPPIAGEPCDVLGAYHTDRRGAFLRTLYEDDVGGGLGDEGAFCAGGPLGLSPNGTLAFSSIRYGRGAIYRGPVGGDLEVLRSGTLQYVNAGSDFLVNDQGTAIARVETAPGVCPMHNAALYLNTPEPAFDSLLKVATNYTSVSLNHNGDVALSLAERPDHSDNVFVCERGAQSTILVPAGVYKVTPTPFLGPPALEVVVDSSGPYASFGKVLIGDDGRVVFEATLDEGTFGIFKGPDPTSDRLLMAGDELEGERVESIALGSLNGAGQLSLYTTSASGEHVWRVSGL